MDLNTLHKNVEQKLYSLMRMRKGDNLKKDSEKILKLLEENKSVLEERSLSHLIIYLLTAIFTTIFAFVFLSGVIQDKPQLLLLCTAGLTLVSLLIVYMIIGAVSYKIDTSILLSHQLSEKGWRFNTLDSEGVWDSLSSKYPFLQKGDMDDAIPLRVYGEYEGFSFCYFEYDYTIEIEEEVAHEDNDGNTYYETEYSYEYYTESCISVDVEHSLPNIKTIAGSQRSDALKFSYIDLNKKMSAYSSNAHQAAVFFDPSTQRVFADFYRYFPSANISIQYDGIFINFGTDLTNLSRSMSFDENLLSYIQGNRTVNTIESILDTMLPLLESLNH